MAGQGLPGGSRMGPRKWIDRTELIRLLQQSLHGLGYSEIAHKLELQSGIQMQPAFATSFQKAVLAGSWQEALELLPELMVGESAQKEGKFLILRQKYHEMLDASDQVGALHCLRMELAPLQVNPKELHTLAGMLLCPWDVLTSGADPEALRVTQRAQVLEEIHGLLKPGLIIPDGRLEQLVEQALHAQVANCQYHNMSTKHLSLFTDYRAGREQLPNKTVKVLENHSDEVWHLQFSHNGEMLASAGKDKTAIVWTVHNCGECIHLHTLSGHDSGLTYVAWSYDDSMLLTCEDGGGCTVWNVVAGELRQKFREHYKTVVAGAWFPDNRRIVTGGHDHKTIIWNVDGEVLKRINDIRLNDLAITSDTEYMICVSAEKVVRLHRLADDAVLNIQGEHAITSLALSADQDHVLVNFACHSIQLWSMDNLRQRLAVQGHSSSGEDLAAQDRLASRGGAPPSMPNYKTEAEPLVEYKRGVPEKQGRFVIRSAFGGSQGNFVVSGSEDSQVYLWHKDSGDLLEVMPGHSGTVNAVSWNRAKPHIMASASDDHTVRIWVAPVFLDGPNL